MKEQPVSIAPYNPNWPNLFTKEQTFLQKFLADYLVGTIEHIGSTAIPNLVAKPVIDIMAPVKSLRDSHSAIEILVINAHYCYFPYKAEIMHWFCKPAPYFRTHHLHLVPYQSQLWKERLAFRDYLRENPEAAQDYAELKLSLAKQYKHDREAYTNEKWPFVKDILEKTGVL